MEPIKLDEKTKQCLFYGHGYMPGYKESLKAFIYSRGNRCPAVMNAHSPCKMERDGQTPNLRCCDAGLALLADKALIESAKIFPREKEKPDGSISGVSLKDWVAYVQEGKPLPEPNGNGNNNSSA